MVEHPTPADARKLLRGTTPGPWAIEGSLVMDRYRSQIITLLGDMAEAYPEAAADAALIAAAPALAAALADHEAEVAALRAENERLRAEADWMAAYIPPCRGCGHPWEQGAHVYGERKCCPDCDHTAAALYKKEQ